MHKKQKIIIHKLSKVNGQRYGKLYKGFEYEDKFPYHLKYLVQNGYVNKRARKYYLTPKGIRAKTYFKKGSFRDVELKIPILIFICRYKDKYLVKKHFVQDPKRRDQYSVPGGKAECGEMINDACTRMLKEKYGVSGMTKYRCCQNYLEYTQNGEILFDDIFLIFDVEVESSPIRRKNCIWRSKEEIEKLENLHAPVKQFILNDDKSDFSVTKEVSRMIFEDDL